MKLNDCWRSNIKIHVLPLALSPPTRVITLSGVIIKDIQCMSGMEMGFLETEYTLISVICTLLHIGESYAEATDIPLDQADCMKHKPDRRFNL
jgi:hypothetical protein